MRRAEIIERLEKAEGASLELEGRVWCAVNGYEFVQWDGAGCVYRDPGSPAWDSGIKHADARTVRPFTASLDSTIALVERTLPGWLISICQHANKMWQADLVPPGGNLSGNICASGLTTAPIALLCCLFRALEAKETRHG